MIEIHQSQPFPQDQGDPNRLRRVFLSAKRDELATPARVIVDTMARLASEAETVNKAPQFADDMRNTYDAALKLQKLIQSLLLMGQAEPLDSSSLAEWQSQFRHSMLNDLTTITGVSELWIEDGSEYFLDAFLPDLELVKDCAYRCVRLIDEILKASDEDSLEFSEDEADQIRHIITARDQDGPGRSGRILVADDIKTNRDYLQRNLERMGHTVQIARTGQHVLERVEQSEFDLLLLDIKMPELDGIEVLSRLKAQDQTRDLPVIMISALSEIEIVAQCIKLGAEDYLPKPFNNVLLQARIDACLEKRRLAQQIHLEKEKSDRLLEVLLPPSIVTELKTHNCVVPRRHERVAVLFADLVGFTQYCEANTPESVMNLLHGLIEQWEESALKHRVEKIKTIGDAFMAATGLWNEAENPVLNCLQCGQEMIAATLNSSPWNLRVGIHVGPVVAGLMGKRKFLFDLWGDTVNTAARMESHGVPGHMTLSHDAWQTVSDGSHGTSLGLIEIKGKGPREMIRFDGFRPSGKLQTQTIRVL